MWVFFFRELGNWKTWLLVSFLFFSFRPAGREEAFSSWATLSLFFVPTIVCWDTIAVLSSSHGGSISSVTGFWDWLRVVTRTLPPKAWTFETGFLSGCSSLEYAKTIRGRPWPCGRRLPHLSVGVAAMQGILLAVASRHGDQRLV
jgi:hypothetical protein